MLVFSIEINNKENFNFKIINLFKANIQNVNLLDFGYWHWIRRPIIIQLRGIINGGYQDETHQLGDLGREDEKRVKEKERKTG